MAAEAILSVVFEQLLSITAEEARKQISLVGDVKKEVNKFTTNFQAIKAVLVDAEQRQVKEETVKLWLDQLRDISYDMEDVLDEWNTEMMKLQIEGAPENVDHLVSKKKVCCFLPSPCFGIKQAVLRRDIALKIKEINENLDDVAKRKDMFNFNVIRSTEKPKGEETTSLVDESEIFGRDDEKKTLVNMLLSESSDSQKGPRVISLVGMGGIGKTTLAQLAYKDDEITRNFDKTLWVCVSDPFDISKIAKAILESLTGNTPNLSTLESLLEKVRESITGKKFFLVLDDVWTKDENEWKSLYKYLKAGLPGSKILVTTRNEEAAPTKNSYSFDILKMDELSNDDCWLLFQNLAFFDRDPDDCEKFEEIGRQIVGKCKGLPLAVKTIGSLLRNKETREEWQLILDNEMWKLESFEKGIFPPILLSYNDLPPMVKSCFLFCAIFPKDCWMSHDELIYLWMAQGYLSSNQNKEMEIIGKEYFDILAARSFFQEFCKDCDNLYVRCKMHDIVHDVALLLSRNECLAIEDNDFENWSTNSTLYRTRHLMVSKPIGKRSPSFVSELKKLRSLLIEDDQFPVNIEKLTHLRALKFDCRLVKKFPMEITKLIYLKFLHLIVGEDIEALPDTLCKLHNLQTLRVEGIYLKRLPQTMEKLIKLRHLTLGDLRFSPLRLSYMPRGIERLTCLRTLTAFVVNGNGDNNDEACSLEGLKKLNHLRGELCISRLGNVKDVREIKGAEFWNKKNLIKLRLDFGGMMPGHTDHEILLEAFDPPSPNLEDLGILGYRGNIIVSSNWMMSLTKLKKLFLSGCGNLECLPPLGKCPYLESLEIWEMRRIKRVSNEFLGVESGVASSSSSSSSPSNIIIFPKLKSLFFFVMENWEDWDYGVTRKDEEHITIMPHLRSLSFHHCPNLRVLPEELFQRITLDEFNIGGGFNQILEERYEEWSKRKQR